MGRIVAIGGGDLSSTEKLNRYAIEMTQKNTPNVLFVGTASSDADEYMRRFYKVFVELCCVVKDLSLTKKEYTEEEIDKLLEWADIIYVGGGDTRSMMDIWKKYGVDAKLKQIYDNDKAVLMGISAGAICWFDCGHSDCEAFSGKEDWEYIFVEGMLDIHHYALCPHYNEEGRDSFDAMLPDKKMTGLALENDTAFVEINGEIKFIRANDERSVYWFRNIDGKVEKTAVETFEDIETSKRRYYGNGWDPKNYVLFGCYNTANYYSVPSHIEPKDRPEAVKCARIATVFAILGMVFPIFVFSIIVFGLEKKFKEITAYYYKPMDVAKKLAAVGMALSIICCPLVLLSIIRVIGLCLGR